MNERKCISWHCQLFLLHKGISFLHAGTEFLRSKNEVENSFESPDSINAIDWEFENRRIAMYLNM